MVMHAVVLKFPSSNSASPQSIAAAFQGARPPVMILGRGLSSRVATEEENYEEDQGYTRKSARYFLASGTTAGFRTGQRKKGHCHRSKKSKEATEKGGSAFT